MQQNPELSWENLCKYLSDKTMLERFLSELLGREVQLKDPPSERDIFDPVFEDDIFAVDTNGERYSIVIQHSKFDFWWTQLERVGCLRGFVSDNPWSEEQYRKSIDIIAICNFDPFQQGKFYYRVGLCVNDRMGNSVCGIGIDSHIRYHICCMHPDGRSDAPERMRQMIDCLNGAEVEKLPELLEDISICWDQRDYLKAGARAMVAEAYHAAMKDQFDNERDIIKFINNYGEGFIIGSVEALVAICNQLERCGMSDDNLIKFLMKEHLLDEFIDKIVRGEKLKETDFYQWFLEKDSISHHSFQTCHRCIRESKDYKVERR